MGFPDSDGFGRGSDSGGFGWTPSSPAGDFFAVFYNLYGHFVLQKWIPDSDGFGRGSDSGGFGSGVITLIMSGWGTLGYPGISTIAHSLAVINVNNLKTGPTVGLRNGPGRRDSRRTAAWHTAYRTRNPLHSQGTPRGALFQLRCGHGARRKRAYGLGNKTNNLKSEIPALLQ